MKNSTAIIINADADEDRPQHMKRMLGRFNVPYRLFSAVQIDRLSQSRIAQYGSPSVRSELRAIACSMSHIGAWKDFLETDLDACMVLEDDVLFSDGFGEFWDEFSIPDDRCEIWKIESCNATCTVSRKAYFKNSYTSFYQLHSLHAATAAYVINRKTAAFLVSVADDFRENIDHELFDPVKRTVPMCRILQAIPALCIQDRAYSKTPEFASTIGDNRKSDENLKLIKFRRQFLSPIVTILASCLMSYQGLKRVKIKYLPIVR